MRTLWRPSVWLVACTLLGAAAPALAQGGRAEINGTVMDAQKAVLPGVTVTVTNEDTGLMREAVTDGTGRYVIPQLLPGPYTVKADLPGFQPISGLCHDCNSAAFKTSTWSQGSCIGCGAIGLVVPYAKIPPLGSPEFSKKFGPLIRALE